MTKKSKAPDTRKPRTAKEKARHQRVKAATKAEVQRRIGVIADMMSGFTWQTRVSHRKLSEEWGCSYNTIEQYAAEASRLVLRSVGDPEQIRGRVLAGMDRLSIVAAVKGELRTAMHGLSELARIAGADQPMRLALTDASGQDLPPQVAALVNADEATLLAFLRSGRLPAREED